LGVAEKFVDCDAEKEYTFTVPAQGKGGIPAQGRITLTAAASEAEFSDLSVMR
jgi:hypothetical protein